MKFGSYSNKNSVKSSSALTSLSPAVSWRQAHHAGVFSRVAKSQVTVQGSDFHKSITLRQALQTRCNLSIFGWRREVGGMPRGDKRSYTYIIASKRILHLSPRGCFWIARHAEARSPACFGSGWTGAPDTLRLTHNPYRGPAENLAPAGSGFWRSTTFYSLASTLEAIQGQISRRSSTHATSGR